MVISHVQIVISRHPFRAWLEEDLPGKRCQHVLNTLICRAWSVEIILRSDFLSVILASGPLSLFPVMLDAAVRICCCTLELLEESSSFSWKEKRRETELKSLSSKWLISLIIMWYAFLCHPVRLILLTATRWWTPWCPSVRQEAAETVFVHLSNHVVQISQQLLARLSWYSWSPEEGS